MILLPAADPARSWQLQLVGGRAELWELMANIVMYSVDRRFVRNKGERLFVEQDEKLKPNRSVTLARIQYDGNWDPEPGGWERMTRLLHNQHRTELKLREIRLADGFGDSKLAHMTGTTRFKLDTAQRERIRSFVSDGGTLIIDAAGGSIEFVESAEQELAAIFGDGALKPLTPDSPVLRTDEKPLAIAYRAYAQRVVGNLRDAPRLQVIEEDGQPLVYFSRDDLSAGLVGQHIDGIIGYTPDTATELMSRLILESVH
jgi:hypothetical protein